MKRLPQILKEFGANVTKNGCAGYYTYNGVNFTVDFNEEVCESKWWEVDVYSDKTSDNLKSLFSFGGEYENYFYTKRELVGLLYQIDLNMSSK